MNCPDCGKPVEKDAQYCPACFARIEPPPLWQKFLRLLQNAGKPHRSMINVKKTLTVNTTDKDGQRHEYHSLDEVPPELRAEIEKVASEGFRESLSSLASAGLTTKTKKSISVFKVKDASGKERIYHSLDELPPEIRTALEQAQNRTTK